MIFSTKQIISIVSFLVPSGCKNDIMTGIHPFIFSFLFGAKYRAIIVLKVSDSFIPIFAAAAVGAQHTAAPVSTTAETLWKH